MKEKLKRFLKGVGWIAFALFIVAVMVFGLLAEMGVRWNCS